MSDLRWSCNCGNEAGQAALVNQVARLKIEVAQLVEFNECLLHALKEERAGYEDFKARFYAELQFAQMIRSGEIIVAPAPAPVECERCSGSGHQWDRSTGTIHTCTACAGTGKQ